MQRVTIFYRIQFYLNLIIKKTLFHPFGKKFRLIIYDDLFPSPITGFRVDEFTYLLQHVPHIKIISDSKTAYRHGYGVSDRKGDVANYLLHNKILPENKVVLASKLASLNGKLFYTVFYVSILNQFKFLKLYKINFVFTLYPGGGWCLYNSDHDNNLRKIINHPLCKGVIVNQLTSLNYLIKRNICQREKVKLIYGLPIADEKLRFDISNRIYFGKGKKQLDIAFVASRYSKIGADKGYDLFVTAAQLLEKKFQFIQFHVIGNFSENTIDVSSIRHKIKFYGRLPAKELRNHLQGFDIILAPNRANILSHGSFDGFPVGCCVEAMLCGTVAITTDPLDENSYYENWKELIIIKSEVDEITSSVETLIKNPDEIKKIGIAGYNKTRYLYSAERQLEERVTYLTDILGSLK